MIAPLMVADCMTTPMTPPTLRTAVTLADVPVLGSAATRASLPSYADCSASSVVGATPLLSVPLIVPAPTTPIAPPTYS